MNNYLKIGLIVFAMLSLILLRTYASQIFYDPLIDFFQASYHENMLPQMDVLGILLNTALRFWINTLVSLILLWLFFQNKEVVQLSLWLYAIAFVLLLVIFYFLIKTYDSGSYMALFYVRRFLIQPLLLLILIPAFYFHKLSK